MRSPRLSFTALVVVAALVAVGCGSSDSEQPSEQTASPPAPAGSVMEHTHGLGVRGETLFIATHTGLWAAPEGQMKPSPVGPSRQDIMGFSVLAPGRFIGSGHPGIGQDGPPNLGLIESRDGGKSWKSISLPSEADFHVLQSQGQRVYGFDGTQGRLMVSSDSGRTWEQRTPPAAMFRLAIDPDDPDTIVASTEKGTFTSPNAGRGWRSLNPNLAGLTAWPATDRLYLVDGRGTVQVSPDGGRQWRAMGNIGGEPAAFIAQGDELYAALADATVKRSSDGGRSWTVRATP